jgi:hypothetical protein
MRQAKYRFILLPLFVFLACVSAFAQANSTVTGIVTDQTGAVVSGAKIVLTDPATGESHSTLSSVTGLYEIAGLNAASYNLKVTSKGFETFEQKDVVVNISATFRVDVKLTVGAENQTITVEANALAVQSDSNVVSTLINEQQISELPTNGRNVISLAALGLGVSGNLPDFQNPLSVNASFSISFNGLSQAHNIWMIDGGEAYDRGSGGKMSLMPSQDALGEFQVLASNYPPDYGISSGGTVTMSIKSGTSKFHGEAWEFDRNNAFDARSYFNPAPAPVSELRYNVFGANVSGPVFIPHVYNESKKKTFFFYNEEWRKEVTGNSPNPINTVPGGDEVTSAANFTYMVPSFYPSDQAGQVFVPIVNPNSRVGKAIAAYNGTAEEGGQLVPGQPFPGNVIPGTLLDANALLFNTTKNIPPSTNANGQYTPSGGKLPVNVREDLFRVDHSFNDKWNVFGHMIHDAEDSVQATPLWQGDNYPTIGSNFSNPAWGAVIKLTGTLSPNVLLEAAFNYDGNKIDITPTTAAPATGFTQPSGWNAATYFQDNNALNRLPNLNLTTVGTQWGPGNDPWRNGAEDYAEVFGLSVTRGKHQIKFGGGYNRYTKNQIIGNNTEGNYTFNDGWNKATHLPISSPGSPQLTGDSYLDFLLGLATNYSQPNIDPINHYVNQTPSIYAEDNWHVNPRLSIQYGLRYDLLPHVWERNNQVSNFVPSQYNTALVPTFDPNGSGAICGGVTESGCTGASPGLQTINGIQYYMNGVVVAGQNGVPRGVVNNFWKTYQPRLGFSLDLTGDGKTVLRGGFGTFFERIQGNDIYDTAGKAPFIDQPSAANVEFTNTSASWQSGTAASTPLFTQQFEQSMAQYYPDPATAMFSLGVQREIAPSLILITQYVGNIDWHQQVNEYLNDYPLNTSMAIRSGATALSTIGALQAVTYPGFGQIEEFQNIATGTYNSLQIGLRQQNKHGLSYEFDYTYGHQIDSTVISQDTPNGNPSSNPWNLKYDKGSGILDRRQVFNGNYEYKIPLFAHDSGFAHTVLGGWEVSGTVISETGLPWAGNAAPNDGGADTVGLGGGYTIRPNISGKPSYTKGKATVGTNSGYQFVSQAGFSQPVAAWLGGPNNGFGDAGKDSVVGPGRTDFTTALYKSFAFGERAHFEFRADSFNTFNHTQFNAFNTNVSQQNFGFVTGAQDPRVWEFGGKFVF